jgi:hypothetical protein
VTGSLQLRDYPGDMARLSRPKCGRAEPLGSIENLDQSQKSRKHLRPDELLMVHSEVNDTRLVLVSARKSRGGGWDKDDYGGWDKDDYDVRLDDGSGPVVGRIMRHPQAPEAQPWFWTITALEQPPSVYNRGYAASREQAMRYFKARYVGRPPT